MLLAESHVTSGREPAVLLALTRQEDMSSSMLFLEEKVGRVESPRRPDGRIVGILVWHIPKVVLDDERDGDLTHRRHDPGFFGVHPDDLLGEVQLFRRVRGRL